MQSNPQELSWQAIQAIVGVKLPSNVLRFDEIGFHLIKNAVPNVIDLDSDVEIVENERADSVSRADSTENGKSRLSDRDTDPEAGSSPKSRDSPQRTAPSDGEDEWNCFVCSAKFTTKVALLDHNVQEHCEESEGAAEAPLSIDDYLEVTLSTDSEASHSCSRCHQIFSSEQLLSAHECTPKPAEEKKYPCHMCADKFASYWELRKHINTHFPGMLDSKSSFCHLCQKDYTKTGFMNHLRKHTGERPFVCELCHKAFSQSSSLSIHMKFHLNVRKHACTMCEKKFVTKSELSRHMTVHTKQKSYYCGVCDKAFTRSDNMKKHEKTHG